MIKLLVLHEGVKKRKFSLEFEVGEVVFEHWKCSSETDEQYIERLLAQALDAQGMRMSE